MTDNSLIRDQDPGPSLTLRTAQGAGWIIVWRMSTRLLGIASTVVLVRLLPPADFGLIALATSFSVMMEWLSGMGVNDALIREKHIDRAMYDTAFTMNLLRGVAIAAAIAGVAFPVAHFFNDPRLANILFVLAVAMFASSAENIGIVDFRRSLSFEMEFRLSVIPRMAMILTSIAFAVVFRNYWALVAGIVTNRVLRFVLTYWMHPHRPRLTLSAWRRLIGYSFYSWLTAVASLVRDRADTIAIGRVFGPTSVGIYSVGWEIGSLTSTELVEPLTAAMFAGFAEAGRTGGDVSEGYFKAMSATLLLTLPLGFGLSLLAGPVIHLAFGSVWAEAVPLAQVFALVCMLKVAAYFSGVLLNAQGLIHIQARIVMIAVAVRLGLLAVLLVPYGMMGAAAAAAGCIAVEETLFIVVTFRRFHLRAMDLLRGIWRSLLATAAMAIVLVWEGVGWAPIPPDSSAMVYDLLLGFASGAATFTVVLLLAWLASGRPRGAETLVLDMLGGIGRSVRRKLSYTGRYQ